MISRSTLARVLLRLYPTAWRAEYGEELTGILLARPLGARVIADVLWNAMRQRAHAAAPSTILGASMMLLVLANIVLSASAYRDVLFSPLRATHMTYPTIEIALVKNEVYVLLTILCGFWTQMRCGRGPKRAGWAAMRMSLIAGTPVIAMGVLYAMGLEDATLLTSGDARPGALMLITAPIARVPESWIWGWVGGQLACLLGRKRAPAQAA